MTGRLGGKGERKEMMHNLYGDVSEDDQIGSDQESNKQPASDCNTSNEGGGKIEAETDESVDHIKASQTSDNLYAENETQQVNQSKSSRACNTVEEKGKAKITNTDAHFHDVFGEFDEDPTEYSFDSNEEEEINVSPMELGKQRVVVEIDETDCYIKKKQKEKAVGPRLELEIPLQPPPASPEELYVMKASNVIGFDPKPFDPETYVEQDVHGAADGGGSSRNCARISSNIVRWREVENPDGTKTRESNARFVKWEDGSVQLMVGNEVLATSVRNTEHDQTHLFLRHGQGILQAQGRIDRKMTVTPSTLSSKSHQQLVDLVGSRHKKVHKVKRLTTNVGPQKEKEQQLKGKSLNRKKENARRKYVSSSREERQLSSALPKTASIPPNEEEKPINYYKPQSSAPHHFKQDPEVDAHRVIGGGRDD